MVLPRPRPRVLEVLMMACVQVTRLRVLEVARMAAQHTLGHHRGAPGMPSLGPMVCLAAVTGAICSAAGAVISALTSLPTGPVIVVLLTSVFLLSLVLAPGRGLLFRRRSHV